MRFFVSILLFFISMSLTAQEWSFTGGLESKYINGEVQELVYAWNAGERYTLSALFWEVENLFCSGPWVQVSRGPLSLSVEYTMPLNQGTGQMRDFDWLGYNYGLLLDLENPEADWTEFSRSDVYIKEYQNFELELSYRTYENRFFGLDVTAGFKYRQMRWEDIPLYYIYSTDRNDRFAPVIFRGYTGEFTADNAINFEWHSSTGLAGLNLWFIPSPYRLPELRFRFQGLFGYYSYRYTVDEHVLRNYRFTDIFTGAHEWDLELSAEYLFGEHLLLSAQYGWSIFPLKDRGTESWTHYLDSGTLEGYSEDSVGSKAYLYHLGLTIAYKY